VASQAAERAVAENRISSSEPVSRVSAMLFEAMAVPHDWSLPALLFRVLAEEHFPIHE
jgi:hypothetical protein